MQTTKAREILQALIQGVDPATGEELRDGAVLQRAEVLRALMAGVTALEQSAARAQRRAHLPPNVGRTWTPEEEADLAAAFRAGESLTDVAIRHERTLRAIEARLERLGLLAPEQRVTHNTFVTPAAGSASSGQRT